MNDTKKIMKTSLNMFLCLKHMLDQNKCSREDEKTHLKITVN